MKARVMFRCTIIYIVFFLFFSTDVSAQSLRFSDTTYVSLGNSNNLRLTDFTLEAWIKIEGYGSTTETGSNGLTGVIPVITRGRAQTEDAVADVNYFMGIKRRDAPLSGYQLVADFEDNTSPGVSPNFPAVSTTTINPCSWTHIAASYNTSTGNWKLYVNGVLSNSINYPSLPIPESSSVANACIGSTLNTQTSIRPGFFNGRIDEARIWNVARTDAQILAGYNMEIPSASNLVARYSFNEASGSTASNTGSAGALATGMITNDIKWVTGFNQSETSTNAALDLNGVHDYVTFGPSSTLNTAGAGTTGFTLEAWIKIEGTGIPTSTGSGGIASTIPIIAKGRGESDASGLNMNYFLGLTPTNILVADFEEAAGANTGLNRPIIGNAAASISPGTWTHVAATYNISDGVWKLFVNGIVVSTLDLPNGIIPENISTQHASLGSALTSNGTPAGFFNGKIDEVRIWKVARSEAEILANYQNPLLSGTGLLGRFGLNENCDTVVFNSVAGSANGIAKSYEEGANPITTTTHPTNGGPSWSSASFDNLPPTAPSNPSPANNGFAPSTSPVLCATVSDPNGGNLRARFYGRPKPPGGTTPFTIVLIPDTQFYTSQLNGGTIAMFNAQTQWITDNLVSKKIVYVGHLGDCVQNGDAQPVEWTRAVNAIATIESPVLTGLPQGIPFGISVGNHDQSTIGDPTSASFYYNQNFGEAHFIGRAYYGGHYGANNDNHYQLFSASGIDFLVISMEFDSRAAFATGPVLDWAEGLVQNYPSRKIIVMTHNLMDESAVFSTQGQAIFNRLSPYTNVILLHGGHVSSLNGGEAFRADAVGGRTLYSILTDYQSRINGGNGLMRYYEFNPITNTVQAKTLSPHAGISETDASSEFSFPMNLNSFTLIGETISTSGSNACLSWNGLTASVNYEWYVELSDGESTVTGPVWTFTAPTNIPLPVSLFSFTARSIDQLVRVQWSTLTEVNSNSFEIQRSSDGSNFITIGSVSGAGNSNTLRSYEYVDQSPLKGVSYYRLVIKDNDNKTSYSGIARVRRDNDQRIDIFPNPVTGHSFVIQLPPNSIGITEVVIYDVAGRMKFRESITGKNEITITHNLAPGIYTIQVTNQGFSQTKKLLVQ